MIILKCVWPGKQQLENGYKCIKTNEARTSVSAWQELVWGQFLSRLHSWITTKDEKLTPIAVTCSTSRGRAGLKQQESLNIPPWKQQSLQFWEHCLQHSPSMLCNASLWLIQAGHPLSCAHTQMASDNNLTGT